jgi:hypothetical protein
VPVTVNVTPNVIQSNLGLNTFKGDTSLNGAPTSTLIGGTSPSAAVSVNLNITLNTAWYNQPYNITGPAGSPCLGTTLQLDQNFIQSHEMQHVNQITAAVNGIFANNGVTYQPSSGLFRYNNTTFISTAIQEIINRNVQQEVDKLAAEDQNEYAAKDNGGSFAPNSLEGQARSASCTDFMNRVGNNLLQQLGGALDIINDINQHLATAQKQADAAAASASQAVNAANAAQAAAAKCDWSAFLKALTAYIAAVTAAEDAINISQGNLAEAADANHAGNLNNMATAYDAAKAAANVRTFLAPLSGTTGKADDVRAEITTTLNTLATVTAKINAQNAQTQKTLDRAKATMDAAWQAMLKCFQGKPDSDDKKAAEEKFKGYQDHKGYVEPHRTSPEK